MTRTELYSTLTDIVHDVFLRDDIAVTPTLSASEVEGWDSLKQIELILAVQQRFAIKLRTREIDTLRNIGDLADIIAQKRGVPPGRDMTEA